MKKTIAGAVLGLVTSIVIASVGNRLLRAARERSRSPADACTGCAPVAPK